MSANSVIEDVAAKHHFSPSAVEEAAAALQRSGGGMAQFAHPELGGSGQWMPGMLMIGDMFNSALKGRVDALFNDLAGRHVDRPAAPPARGTPAGEAERSASGGPSPASSASRNWYPDDLGTPSSAGAQNGIRYAFFPGTRRLAIERAGRLEVYDAADHAIGGVSQQQSGGAGGRLAFASQHGDVDLTKLHRVS